MLWLADVVKEKTIIDYQSGVPTGLQTLSTKITANRRASCPIVSLWLADLDQYKSIIDYLDNCRPKKKSGVSTGLQTVHINNWTNRRASCLNSMLWLADLDQYKSIFMRCVAYQILELYLVADLNFLELALWLIYL